MKRTAEPRTATPRGAREPLRIRPNPEATPAGMMKRYRKSFPGLIEAMGRVD